MHGSDLHFSKYENIGYTLADLRLQCIVAPPAAVRNWVSSTFSACLVLTVLLYWSHQHRADIFNRFSTRALPCVLTVEYDAFVGEEDPSETFGHQIDFAFFLRRTM